MAFAPANPFFFGSPVRSASDFFGRTRQLRAVFGGIQKGECTNVIGERRSGKTSLLLHVLDPEVQRTQLPEDNLRICVYYSAGSCPQNPSEFYQEVFRLVKARCPEVPIAPDEDVMDERRVRAYLRLLAPRRLVLLIDEFENMSLNPSFPSRFFTFLRSLCEMFELGFVISTRKGLFESCSHEALTSPFPNIFKPVVVGAFADDEFAGFVDAHSARSGVPLRDIQSEIADMAGYLPYLVQIACFHAFEVWQDQGHLGPSTHALIRQRFESDSRAHFEYVWPLLTPDQCQLLSQLTEGRSLPMTRTAWDLEQRGFVTNGRIASTVFAEFVRGHNTVSRRGVVIDAGGHVRVDERSVELTRLEFDLIKYLYDNKGAVCDRDSINDAVWPGESEQGTTDERLDTLTKRLRRRLEPDGGPPWRYIKNVRGRGFMLADGDT